MQNPIDYKTGGFIPLKEYIADIKRFRKEERWRLPLTIVDRIQLNFLFIIARFSLFSALLHIKHPYPWRPAYALLIQYLRKKQILDTVEVRTLLHPGFFSFFAKRRILKGETTWKINGHGVSRDRETALSKTLGEIIERSVSGLGDENRQVILRSPSELIANKVPLIYPPDYHRYLPHQLEEYGAKLKHDPQELMEWVTGYNLVTKRPTLIPRHMTSWFLGGRLYKKMLQHTTSNGSAAYFTKEGAVYRALLEVVQRDAILTHWLTKTPPRKIISQTLPDTIQLLIKDSERIGITVHILDITALSIPTVCVVAVTKDAENPQVVLSAATALTTLEAVTSSLEELINIAGLFGAKERDGDDANLVEVARRPFVSKLDARTRQLYWRGTERLQNLDWFFSGPEVSFEEVSRYDLPVSGNDTINLQTCVSVLEKLGTDYYPTVYHPLNKVQNDLQFFVAQVFIPKAFPLYLIEYYGTFQSKRLEDFALSKGLKHWELNKDPHMFS